MLSLSIVLWVFTSFCSSETTPIYSALHCNKQNKNTCHGKIPPLPFLQAAIAFNFFPSEGMIWGLKKFKFLKNVTLNAEGINLAVF